MASKVTRWGIAGAGKISTDFAIGVSCSEDNKIMAIGSRSVERSNEFAKKFGIPKTYGSYEELAADKDIDVVYMGVIHPSHYPLMKLFLNSGRNVLCEKPLTYNSRHSKEVIALAKNKGLFLMEGYWSRFFPVYDDLRKELADKTIGEPKFVDVTFGGIMDKTAADWHFNKTKGAGALMSIGCYCIMFSQLVFNHEKPEQITATAIMSDEGFDASVHITLRYSNQRVANTFSSKIHNLPNSAHVYGDKGDIKIPLFWGPDEITTPSGTKKHPLPKTDHSSQYFRGEGFMYEAQSVRECLLKGLTENPLMTHDQTLQIQEIMDEVKRQIGLVYEGEED